MTTYNKGLTTNRYQFSRGPITQEIKTKLIKMIENSSGKHEILAEDIIEIVSVARNDPDGFRAVNKLLDRLKEEYHYS
ncbi:hypothetical protein [Xenorhabdus sp. KK7.4]|uniref:hypothetical protein n=1 Tax=Xenorhabdus sp. KK7.4 TaxID=1851572 RepID=UPI000C051319|nr:hypothetical protein [Xenorhabdus sp. KK7.4]PHM51276.1 hypothetical protein Xekk_03849 [Xenorhabdus sp. KK7.4]